VQEYPGFFYSHENCGTRQGNVVFPTESKNYSRKPGERNIAEDVIFLVTQQLPMKEFVSLYVQRRIAFMPFSRD
jgi:hypothetical protein